MPKAHPKSSAARRPELVWAGKDEALAAAEARGPGTALEPVAKVPPAGLLTSKKPTRNRLIGGDNLRAMRALLPELRGRLDLVYIDPPFATGSEFKMQGRAALEGDAATAYDDDWGSDLSAFFAMLYPRLVLMRELLSEHGTIYVHLDWSAGHHVRLLLDEIFGAENSLGEIIWAYGSPSGGRAAAPKLVKSHETIFVYAKRRGRHRFKPVYLPYSERYVRDWFKFEDDGGRRYRKRWRRNARGESVVEKQYLDESKGVPASTVWTDIQQVYADPRAYKAKMTSEVTGFPTQKPTRLLERILEISTEPGDLVADFFCGSGTTLVAAERMGRDWIGCDAGELGVKITRERLMALPERRAFEVISAL